MHRGYLTARCMCEMKRKRKAPDLNTKLKRSRTSLKTKAVEVWVDDIAAHIAQKLALCDEALCCVAWLSNAELLAALEKLDGVRIVLTKDKLIKRYVRAYERLPKQGRDNVAVKALGSSRRGSSMMHHKFCIGLRDGKALFVITGSFNWSASATRALENVLCLSDPAVVDFYQQEHAAVWKAAKKCY